jgi:hypothetical protein
MGFDFRQGQKDMSFAPLSDTKWTHPYSYPMGTLKATNQVKDRGKDMRKISKINLEI